MSFFARQLLRGNNFGKQLGQSANIFGRQMANSAKQASSVIGQAQRFVSNLEKAVPDNVPIVDKALKTVSTGLKGAENLSSLAGIGGQALRQASAGDMNGLRQSLENARGTAGQLANNVRDTVASGSALLL